MGRPTGVLETMGIALPVEQFSIHRGGMSRGKKLRCTILPMERGTPRSLEDDAY
jgi:hypothetical protein